MTASTWVPRSPTWMCRENTRQSVNLLVSIRNNDVIRDSDGPEWGTDHREVCWLSTVTQASDLLTSLDEIQWWQLYQDDNALVYHVYYIANMTWYNFPNTIKIYVQTIDNYSQEMQGKTLNLSRNNISWPWWQYHCTAGITLGLRSTHELPWITANLSHLHSINTTFFNFIFAFKRHKVFCPQIVNNGIMSFLKKLRNWTALHFNFNLSGDFIFNFMLSAIRQTL